MATYRANTLDEVALIAGFVHDATLITSDVSLDFKKGCISFEVKRFGYELARREKILGLIPVTRYPGVCSLLEVQPVSDISQVWTEDAFDQPDDQHILLDVRFEGTSVLVETDHFTLFATRLPSMSITLRDLSEPEGKIFATDFGHRPIFSGASLLQELRIDA